jgi:hypothetical protein
MGGIAIYPFGQTRGKLREPLKTNQLIGGSPTNIVMIYSISNN